MSERSLFTELKRRNVYRAATFYAAGSWLLVQVATQVFPFFDIPNRAVRVVVVAALIGFPLVLLLSWFYEWTPEGLKRERDVDRSESITHVTGKKLDRGIIAVLSLTIVLLLADRFVVHRDATIVADRSIAVLPLANASDDKDEQYFSDGLSEDLISALSQFAGLKVISRNSSFQFRDTKDDSRTIGRKLGVAHLLDGSVRRASGEVRVSAELINVADGSTLWSQSYVRPYQDLFALQEEIARAVVAELKATTLLANSGAVVQSDRPPSGSLDAYNAYLEGKFYGARGTEADYRKAIEFYDGAIRLDRSYALAHASRAFVWINLARKFLDGAEAQEAYANARAASDTALSLAPDLAAVHRVRGVLFESADFNWTAAEAEYRRALELAPNDGAGKTSLAGLRATLGDPEQAVDLTREGVLSDPLRASSYNYLAAYLASLGRLDEAEQAIRKAIELQPAAADYHTQLAVIEILRGDAAAALDAALQENAAGGWLEIALALARQIGGDRAAADTSLQVLLDGHADDSAYQIAQVYALRGDPDRMFEWLDRAWANRDAGIGYLLYDPLLQPYESDPRFAAFCGKVGLPAPEARTQ